MKALAAALALLLTLAHPGGAAAANLPETLQRVKPSVVAIGTVQLTRRPPARFYATAFVVADGRHALTNAHAIPRDLDIGHKEFLAIFVPGDQSFRRAQVVKTDADHDLSVVRFDGAALPALALGDSGEVREGKLYGFTGFPIGTVLGLYPATHRAIVSAITPIAIPQTSSRQLDTRMVRRLREPYDVFQLDATAYPGSSGSPLFDVATGRVVGVLNKVFVSETKENVLERPSGISYAIPSVYARELLREAGVQ